MDTFPWETTVLKLFWHLAEKESTLEGKNLLPLFFPFTADSFSEVAWRAVKGITKVAFLGRNG